MHDWEILGNNDREPFSSTIVVSDEDALLAQAIVDDFNQGGYRIHERPIQLTPYSVKTSLIAAMAARDFPMALISSHLQKERFDEEWHARHLDNGPLDIAPRRVAASPIIMLMSRQMADKLLRWTDQTELGWRTLTSAVSSNLPLRIMRAHGSTQDGELISVAQYIAVTNDDNRDALRSVEASVVEYGLSDQSVLSRAINSNGLNVDVVIAQERHVLHALQQARVADTAIVYPREGTVWLDYQLAFLPFWDVERQHAIFSQLASHAQEVFPASKLSQIGFHSALNERSGSRQEVQQFYRQQQIHTPEVLNYGARPMVLPGIKVVRQIGQVWTQAKRAVDVCLLLDISGSMGDSSKLPSAKQAIGAFLDKFQDLGSRVHLLVFDDNIDSVTASFQPIVNSRAQIKMKLSPVGPRGSTALLDAVRAALRVIAHSGNESSNQAIVALTDGQENASSVTEHELLKLLSARPELLFFGVAYGSDADKRLLQRLASTGRGKVFEGSPVGIQALYEEIALYI